MSTVAFPPSGGGTGGDDGAGGGATDAYLLHRANHTGIQAISTVTGLEAALDSKLESVALEDVTDVTIVGTPTDATQYGLTYDTATGYTLTPVDNSGVALEDVTNVTTGTPTDATQYALTYDTATGYTLTPVEGGSVSLADVTDVTTGTPTDAVQYGLTYDAATGYTLTPVVGGGETGTYTNANPVPTTIGGVLTGTTFDNTPITDVLDMLLYPFLAPAFTSFSGVPSPFELGDTLASSTVTFSWNTSNSGNVAVDSISITENGTTIGSGLPNSGSGALAITGATYTTPSTHTFRISAVNTQGNTLLRNLHIYWYGAIFYGESALEVLTETDVKALRVKELKSFNSGIYDFNAGDYKWICYPTFMGLRTTFKDISTNFDVAMEAPITVSVTNSFGVTLSYYCHRTFNTLGGSIAISVGG